MSEHSEGHESERSINSKNKGLPKKENYEDKGIWDWDMSEYFTDKVVLTDEEYKAYMEYIENPSWDVLPTIIESVDFEIGGKRYSAVAVQFPSDRQPHDWKTRIFVVKEK